MVTGQAGWPEVGGSEMADVRFGSKADVTFFKFNVRYSLKADVVAKRS
jgi:hypothetical protein